jgi:hypothetical protein
MKYSELLAQLPTNGDGQRSYGEPYQLPDGTAVILVTKPNGLFVIRGGEASWVPAVDANLVALIGVVTGLLAAVIGSLAVLRQPPWPRITITDYR